MKKKKQPIIIVFYISAPLPQIFPKTPFSNPLCLQTKNHRNGCV
jgi:hypothetical protein